MGTIPSRFLPVGPLMRGWSNATDHWFSVKRSMIMKPAGIPTDPQEFASWDVWWSCGITCRFYGPLYSRYPRLYGCLQVKQADRPLNHPLSTPSKTPDPKQLRWTMIRHCSPTFGSPPVLHWITKIRVILRAVIARMIQRQSDLSKQGDPVVAKCTGSLSPAQRPHMTRTPASLLAHVTGRVKISESNHVRKKIIENISPLKGTVQPPHTSQSS